MKVPLGMNHLAICLSFLCVPLREPLDTFIHPGGTPSNPARRTRV
jgi:hypothetical protein